MNAEKRLEKLMGILEKDHGVKGCFILTDDGEVSFFNNESVFHEASSRMRIIADGFEELKKMEWVERHVMEPDPKESKDTKRYIG